MFALLRTLAEKSGLTASRCPICDTLRHGGPGVLCDRCAEGLSPRVGGFCPQCGEMFEDDEAPPVTCPECLHTPQPWDRLIFHGVYAGTLRDLILSYKFNRSFAHARLLARLAHGAFTLHGGLTPDAIVPVPLHRRRLAWRGFNQSTELSREIGQELGIPVWNRALIRIRHTRPQTRLDRQERQENIKGAFTADADKVCGKRLLLVDDVYTTGATLRECAQAVNRAGASGVDVLVLARAMG